LYLLGTTYNQKTAGFKAYLTDNLRSNLSYQIPQLKDQELELTLTIKNSRFIANLRHANGRDECDIHLNDMRRKYPDANHYCWAVVAAAPDNSTYWGLSDAGEPSGTAGKPMLQVLSHCGIGEVSVVVCRYFGGTKLGTGGLVKAYGEAVKQVVEQCPTTLKQSLTELHIECHYDLSGQLEYLCKKHDALINQRHYSDSLSLNVAVPSLQLSALRADIAAFTSVKVSTQRD
jgi:uncharacterized YigZ family protein